MIPAEAAAQPGQWRTSKVPWMKEPMDAYKDDRVRRIVMKFSAQMAKTEGIINMIGYTMDKAPEPMVLMLPTGGLVKTWVKDRLDPTIRDTIPLREKVRDQEKDKFAGPSTKETLVHKNFPGGHFTAIGGNSTAETSMRPVGKLFVDEIDRVPLSIGKNGQVEGDPFLLLEKRGNTFWNRKSVIAATPTVEGISRVDDLWKISTMERFFLPCVHCGMLQYLKFENLKFDTSHPMEAVYVCEHCGCELTDADKSHMLPKGVWIAEHPERFECRGFHMNELYSPWRGFGIIAQSFLEAKRGGRETLRVFINTVLGEVWDEKKHRDDEVTENVEDRGEAYRAAVPMEAPIVTAAVDVQHDRLEIMFMAHGIGGERWIMADSDEEGRTLSPIKIFGTLRQDRTRRELDQLLARSFKHESGRTLISSLTLVDSGDGTTTNDVYSYTKPRQKHRVFSSKGSSNPQAPLTSRPTDKNHKRATLYSLGVNAAKSMIDDSIRNVGVPGPGFLHFPNGLPEEFYRQLRAEKAIIRYRAGVKFTTWEKVSERNEVLDLIAMNICAFSILDIKDMQELVNNTKLGIRPKQTRRDDDADA